jgi:curved DNA-binding protein CbpA
MTEDWYGILGATIESTEKEIKKCYRKKALLYHPDKNRNNPEAGALFAKVQLAYEFLQDESKKKAYDATLRAKLERQLHLQKQDIEVQKMRAELERKEKEAAEARAQGNAAPKRPSGFEKMSPEAKLLATEEALRKKRAEFTRQQSAELIAEFRKAGQLTRTPSKAKVNLPTRQGSSNDLKTVTSEKPREESTDTERTISIQWKKRKRKAQEDDADSSTYNEASLRSLFGVYGRIAHLVVKPRMRRALIMFSRKEEAILASRPEQTPEGLRVGLVTKKSESPLSEASPVEEKDTHTSPTQQPTLQKDSKVSSQGSALRTSLSGAYSRPNVVHEDYESQTLLRMAQLIAQQKKLAQARPLSEITTT